MIVGSNLRVRRALRLPAASERAVSANGTTKHADDAKKSVDGRPLPTGANVATLEAPESVHPVLAGLVTAVHDLRDINEVKSWMAGTRPAMTS
jgi:hypothetical protein